MSTINDTRYDDAACAVVVLDSSPIFGEALTQSLPTAGLRTVHGDIAQPLSCPPADVVILDGDQPTVAVAVAGSLRRLGRDPRILLLVNRSTGTPKRTAADVGAQG